MEISSRVPLDGGRTLLVLCGCLLLAVATGSARADDARFNGSWVLDAARSEDFAPSLQAFNEKLQARKHKKTQGDRHFGGLGGELRSNNAYSGESAVSKAAHKSTVITEWQISDDLRTLLEAQTIKLYQANLCAILYDKKLKRLVSINNDRNSYALTDNASPRDAIGRSVSYIEGGMLIVDTDIIGGDRLIESFALNDTGTELTVAVKLRRGDVGRPLEFKRVYTRGE